MPDDIKPQLVVISFLIYDPEPVDEEIFGNSPLVRELTNKVVDLIQEFEPQAKFQSSTFYSLQSGNCDRCSKCGAWTRDSWSNDKSDPYQYMSAGTFHNGLLLCDLCLPDDHPLHF